MNCTIRYAAAFVQNRCEVGELFDCLWQLITKSVGDCGSELSTHLLGIDGFRRMWYVVIMSICVAVKAPAPTKLCASAEIRDMVFSEAGRSGLSRRERMMVVAV